MGRSKLTQCRSQRVFQKLNQERVWTTNEKEMLLLGIRLHGTANYDLLKDFVPRRTMSELRNFLQMHKLDGTWKPKVPDSEPPLDLWLNNLNSKDKYGCLNAGNSREICQLFKMIALGERHAPPELCNGVNFKELYYYLATILGGTHPKRISIPSAQTILHCCMWLTDMTIGQDLTEVNSFLNKVNSSSEGERVKTTYSKVPVDVPSPGSINADPSLNPLGVPCKMLMLSPMEAAHLSFGLKTTPSAPQRVQQHPEQEQQVEDMQIASDEEIQRVQLTFVDQSIHVNEDTEFSVVVQS